MDIPTTRHLALIDFKNGLQRVFRHPKDYVIKYICFFAFAMLAAAARRQKTDYRAMNYLLTDKIINNCSIG